MTTARLVLGPPGTGKTEKLLLELERQLERGVPPSRIAFISFTRAAVLEARERATQKFNLKPTDLTHWRTLHSTCFNALGLRRGDVFGREDLSELADLTGEEIGGRDDPDALTIGDRGDALLFLEQLARNQQRSLRATWEDSTVPVDWFRLERFKNAYELLREDLLKTDFTDMLERYAAGHPPLPLDVAFLDEAQDLTPLQWAVADRALSTAGEIWIAGDDDQAIYQWCGATADPLITFNGERTVLSQSYRLPRSVHALAASIAATIERRNVKAFAPRDDEGKVEWLTDVEHVDLSQPGTWLLLARTRRQLSALAECARSQGVPYSVMGVPAVDPALVRAILGWERLRAGHAVSTSVATTLMKFGAVAKQELNEAVEHHRAELGLGENLPIWHDALSGVSIEEREFLIACLRRGEKLTGAPRVRVSTVHGAKGAQADRVLLLTDTSQRVWHGAQVDPDAEQRVLYVAVTRARQELFLVERRTDYGYVL